MYREAPPRNALGHCAKWLINLAPNASLFLQGEALGPPPYDDQSTALLPTLEARPVDYLSGDGRFVISQRLADGGEFPAIFEVDYPGVSLALVSQAFCCAQFGRWSSSTSSTWTTNGGRSCQSATAP